MPRVRVRYRADDPCWDDLDLWLMLDYWRRDMRNYGYAVTYRDENPDEPAERVALLAEANWRPCDKTSVPSRLWDRLPGWVVGYLRGP